MLINSDKFLIWSSKIIKNKNHPFELENKNIMTFEEWEYLKQILEESPELFT